MKKSSSHTILSGKQISVNILLFFVFMGFVGTEYAQASSVNNQPSYPPSFSKRKELSQLR